MGGAACWLAFNGISRSAVLDRLKLQPATEPNPEIFGAKLPDGWYLVLGNGLSFMDDAIMNQVCSDGCAVSCFLHTSVMISAAAGWEKGRRIWSVLHEGEQDVERLEIEGALPERFAEIREASMAKQTAQGDRPRVDYIWNIPIDLAASIAGFHYERGTSIGYPDLEPLELAVIPAMPAEPWLEPSRTESWFSKYFG